MLADRELRTRALEMAVEICRGSNYEMTLAAARQFYRFLSNEQDDDDFMEKVMKGRGE